jgi:DNA-binding MarR family transcriptional regulator
MEQYRPKYLDVKRSHVKICRVSADDVERDRIDERVGRWEHEIPGVDLEVESMTQRIHMLHRALEKSLSETTGRFGLTVGEYMVLTALRGSGSPYRLPPSRLAEACWLSSGAMTNRVDNLEREGLVERLPDAEDRRSVQVMLTEKGHRRWEEASGTAAARESLVASALDAEEKLQLNALLRRLVLAAEREVGPIKKKPLDD